MVSHPGIKAPQDHTHGYRVLVYHTRLAFHRPAPCLRIALNARHGYCYITLLHHTRVSMQLKTAHARVSMQLKTAHARVSMRLKTAHARVSVQLKTAHTRVYGHRALCAGTEQYPYTGAAVLHTGHAAQNHTHARVSVQLKTTHTGIDATQRPHTHGYRCGYCIVRLWVTLPARVI
jgi:hypothetical protein